ncbi:hypothetical protein HAX54_001676 [Datura stramonium]|uniref:Uncharacterized protein n=1 Tax=Datura stramonium TaxID=4076 RepID=A0ABS8WQV3_DATST|nr:hypothetical protein [Datura stramonium]
MDYWVAFKISDETAKGSFLWLLILLGYVLGTGSSWRPGFCCALVAFLVIVDSNEMEVHLDYIMFSCYDWGSDAFWKFEQCSGACGLSSYGCMGRRLGFRMQLLDWPIVFSLALQGIGYPFCSLQSDGSSLSFWKRRFKHEFRFWEFRVLFCGKVQSCDYPLDGHEAFFSLIAGSAWPCRVVASLGGHMKSICSGALGTPVSNNL